MRKRKFALGAIIIMIALFLYFSYQNLQSIVVSRILPTQTSIFTGPVDINVINKLRKPQWNGQISRKQAIGLAELYCSQDNSSPERNPTNIEASLMTETEAHIRLNDVNTGFSIKPVWLVSMDGTFEVDPPLAGPNATAVPILLKHCKVVIDAKSGDMSALQHKGQP